MSQYKAYKTELDPNNWQRTQLARSVGAARFAYNWALASLIEDHKSGQNLLKPNAILLHKKLCQIKREQFPWMYEVSKCCPQYALQNLENAFKKFFNKKAKFPRFKKKGQSNSASFDGSIWIDDEWVQIPKIGKIRLKEHRYLQKGKPKTITICEKAGRWFVSIFYEADIVSGTWEESYLGVDLGIKALATCSDGTVYEPPKKLRKKEKALRLQQRRLSRKQKKSANRKKQQLRVARLHMRIANHRKDLLHKITSELARTKPHRYLVLEDLNVRGMLKNHCLAKAIQNVRFGEFRRQLEYKCQWYGKELILVDRFFPSSKTCRGCGSVQDMPLHVRTYDCPSCGLSLDRDLNAALNLAYEGHRLCTVSSTGIDASGDRSSDSMMGLSRSQKEEINLDHLVV